VNLERLRLSDFVLDKCGRPQLPDGTRILPMYRTLVYQQVVNTGQYLPDEKQSLQSDTIFVVSSISIVTLAAIIYLRIQWPNGRFLTSAEQQINGGFTFGEQRRALCAEIPKLPGMRGVVCPPGSQIRLTLRHADTAAAQEVVIAFHGADVYFLKKGSSQPCCIHQL